MSRFVELEMTMILYTFINSNLIFDKWTKFTNPSVHIWFVNSNHQKGMMSLGSPTEQQSWSNLVNQLWYYSIWKNWGPWKCPEGPDGPMTKLHINGLRIFHRNWDRADQYSGCGGTASIKMWVHNRSAWIRHKGQWLCPCTSMGQEFFKEFGRNLSIGCEVTMSARIWLPGRNGWTSLMGQWPCCYTSMG